MSSTTSWWRGFRFHTAAVLACLLALGYLLATPVAARVAPGAHQDPSVASGLRALQQIVEASADPETTGVDVMGPNVFHIPMPFNATVNATEFAQEALNVTTVEGELANRTVSTIFAPTDAAFERLAASLNLTSPLDLFNGTFNATIANITALHVIPGEAISTANFTAGANVTRPTLLEGFNITIMPEPTGAVLVTIPGSDVVATVVTPNVPYEGNIVHVIDKVLLPPPNVMANWETPLFVNETGL